MALKIELVTVYHSAWHHIWEGFGYYFHSVLHNISPDLDYDLGYTSVLGLFKILLSHLETDDQF
jgi:hypothetical protein